MINKLLKLKYINKLKEVYRFNSVNAQNKSIRKESSAEHSWSCIVLADYFLTSFEFDINRLKVYELLLYHDLHEIESGDFALDPNIEHTNKKEKELQAIEKVTKNLPKSISDKYSKLIFEFENLNSKEAKFAKAIDVFDSQLHEVDFIKDWKGWTEEFLRNKKEHLFEDFPKLLEAFNDLIKYLRENKYFDQ